MARLFSSKRIEPTKDKFSSDRFGNTEKLKN